MAATAQYASTVRAVATQITTASSAVMGGTTAIGTLLLAAGASGTRIDDITIQAAATSTSGMVRFFISNGSTYSILLKEVQVSPVIVSGIQPAFTTSLSNLAWVIPSGMQLRATSETANAINIIITRAGDF